MKRITFLLFFLIIGATVFGQSDNTDKTSKTTKADKAEVKFPAYVENPAIPKFNIIAAPDSTAFTEKDLKKDTPLLMMIFSPECGHCQQEAKLIGENIEHFKNAQILMVTWMPYSTLDKFGKYYGTNRYSNITLAQDPTDFLYGFYDVHRYPKLIVYNKDGQYVSDYDGNIVLEDVWKDLGGE